ncbi:ATP-sensitive inward rectifier potassium channel 1-like [Trichomycterus rosablanca]|uniref:ATP-sensitive inward rectifier potassium channel 1-like n=1 Tax=Trichomycterus rosablanca TaxID=2290929 RepID=UPI002F3565D6
MTRTLSQLLLDYLIKRQIHQNRLVRKDGHCNIEYGNVWYSNRLAYMLDLWTSVLELHWSLVMILFTASFIFSWVIFAALWYCIGYRNGDLWWQYPSVDHSPCVIGVDSFTTAFLYSITTQMTIGYSVRVLTTLCSDAITVLVAQSLIGTVIKSFWAGVIVSKFSLPKKRAKTIFFSETAVICLKNGGLCLQIRVANLRKTLMIGSQFFGKLLRTTITPEGETIIMDQISIDFQVDAGKDNLFFACPLTLYHVIDKTSPFYEMAVDTLHLQEFELLVFMEGTDESTNFFCQARTSYIPREIMWGYEFFPIISHNKDGTYYVDFSEFARVVPVLTPHCAYCLSNDQTYHYASRDGINNQGLDRGETEETSEEGIKPSVQLRSVRKMSKM